MNSSFPGIEVPFTKKKKKKKKKKMFKQNLKLFLHMLLKLKIIQTKMDQVIRLWTDTDFSETPSISQMISIFLKHPVFFFFFFFFFFFCLQ